MDKELFKLTKPFRKIFGNSKDITPPHVLSSKSLTRQDTDRLCLAAKEYFSQKEYHKALNLFKEVCHYNYFDGEGWLGLGKCYQEFKKFDEAIVCYSIASSINLDKFGPFYNTYECQLALKNYEGAIAAAKSISTGIFSDAPTNRKEFAEELIKRASELQRNAIIKITT